MFNFFKKNQLTKIIFFVAADIFFINISIWLAFLLRFEWQIPFQYIPFIYKMIVLAIIFTIPVFYFKKLYSFSWSYVSTSEALSLFIATTISCIFLSIVIFFSKYFPNFINFPRSTIFVSYILIFIFCGGVRIAKRIYLGISKDKEGFKKEKVLIAGAGDAGEQILRSMMSLRPSLYELVGFVDDNPIKKGVSIHGLKVLGKISDIPELSKKYEINQLIIALPSAGRKLITSAVEFGRKAGLKKIRIAPPLNEIIGGDISFKNLKIVEIEDLLGREEINLDTKQIKGFIEKKTVLITGAAGSIGSELSRQIAKFNPKLLILLDQDETGIFNISKELHKGFPGIKIISRIADVRDEKKLGEIFKEYLPEIIFHAAAYKHVPLMEENPDEAVKNNIFGTSLLAKACLEYGAEKFIFISTDKAVNPTSIMGATKRISEMLCNVYNQKGKTKFISVRFGNVLNSRGSVIPIFREQITHGGPVEVTHPDMKRYFMLTSEACLLVMQAGAMGQGGEVFVLDMGEPVKILDLAKEMIKLSGLELNKDIVIVFTGIRPGEKLFEEMLTSEEGTVATKNQKIFVAKLSNVNEEKLVSCLEKVNNLINTGEKFKIIDVLKDIIPYHNLK